MSDLELRSQLYGFLGGATSTASGAVWDHDLLRLLVDKVIELPAMRDLLTAAPPADRKAAESA